MALQPVKNLMELWFYFWIFFLKPAMPMLKQ